MRIVTDNLLSFCLFVCTGINACIEAMKLVNEEPYEINVDIYGIRDGPRLGRLRLQNKVGFSFSVIIKSLVPFTVIGIIFFFSF